MPRRLAELQRHLRDDQQSLGQGSLAGRLLRRVVRGAGRGLRPFVARLRHRRLAARSSAFLRDLRAQADLRARRLPRPFAAAACPPGRGAVDLAVVGPMARCVDDLSLALDLIAGPDEAADGRAYRLSLPPARAEKLSDYRVLVIAEHPLLPTSAAVGASLDRLSKQLVKPPASTSDARRRSFRISRRRPALRQAPATPSYRRECRTTGIRKCGVAAEKIPADDREPGGGDLAWGAAQPSGMATGRFRATGLKQQWRALFATSTSSSVRRLRRPPFPTIIRSPKPTGSSVRRRQGISLSPSTGLGRPRDALRPAGDCHSYLGRGRPAGRGANHRPRIRRPHAARLRETGRARIRRVYRPARLRLGDGRRGRNPKLAALSIFSASPMHVFPTRRRQVSPAATDAEAPA